MAKHRKKKVSKQTTDFLAGRLKKPKEYKVTSGLPGADRISIGYHGRGAKAYAAEVVKLGNQTAKKTGGSYAFKTEKQSMPTVGKTKAGNQRRVTVHRIHIVDKRTKKAKARVRKYRR